MENCNNSTLNKLITPFLRNGREIRNGTHTCSIYSDIYSHTTILNDESYESSFIKISDQDSTEFEECFLDSYFLYWNISTNKNLSTNFIEQHRDIIDTKLNTEKRLERLLTFEGDELCGFEKPSSKAVSNVNALLRTLLSTDKLPAPPLISVAQDGEVIVSWRTYKAYFILSFEDADNIEWVFKNNNLASGVFNLTQYEDISKLANILLKNISDYTLESGNQIMIDSMYVSTTQFMREIKKIGSAIK